MKKLFVVYYEGHEVMFKFFDSVGSALRHFIRMYKKYNWGKESYCGDGIGYVIPVAYDHEGFEYDFLEKYKKMVWEVEEERKRKAADVEKENRRKLYEELKEEFEKLEKEFGDEYA